MKLIIGLGNPGEKYKNNRHNIGFSIVDRLWFMTYGDTAWEETEKFSAVICKPSKAEVIFVKPQSFMNDSGQVVKKLVNYYKIDIPDVWVIHDDLDIRLGQYKIQQSRGPKLHYGVNSIEKELGREDFWRVRMGVDNRPSFAKASAGKQMTNERRIPGEEYVLQNFTEDELGEIDKITDNVTQELRNRTMNDKL